MTWHTYVDIVVNETQPAQLKVFKSFQTLNISKSFWRYMYSILANRSPAFYYSEAGKPIAQVAHLRTQYLGH